MFYEWFKKEGDNKEERMKEKWVGGGRMKYHLSNLMRDSKTIKVRNTF